jgi:hypothetical protein
MQGLPFAAAPPSSQQLSVDHSSLWWSVVQRLNPYVQHTTRAHDRREGITCCPLLVVAGALALFLDTDPTSSAIIFDKELRASSTGFLYRRPSRAMRLLILQAPHIFRLMSAIMMRASTRESLARAAAAGNSQDQFVVV